MSPPIEQSNLAFEQQEPAEDPSTSKKLVTSNPNSIQPQQEEGKESEKTDSTPISASKAKLNAVIGDGSFDQLVKARMRVRKEKDEHSVAELKIQMSNLERALAAEIKRRIDSNRKLEEMCVDRVKNLEKKLENMVEDRSSAIMERLLTLENRIDDVQSQFDEMATDLQSSIEKKGRKLKERLDEIDDTLKVEKRDRLNREGRILKQLVDHEEMVSKQLASERTEREKKVAELKERIQRNESGRMDSDKQYSELVQRELKMLKEGLEREMNERKMEDDAIVDALNRYTSKLQSTLNVISFVDA
mmetsp:Transcript_1814/g.2733  ORF Transcript_1814/g.2733 Transcript_1814/m.2733 type:complete len:303 (-) Transcript_1814:64-972(-)|eukprot:CAMPEP_0195520724 /NCGR_PEP_ID=MMETSP0794_2-20130614/17492_1 /TAXON_ID=515487 /ORGANISM="Stephanopyxis turris, Strain CCMP 815" /LENGTH=302 /DNA_ID=CAMNT_0040650143 /DNA_START=70 /DNA_END=978 /DNA_ORIENTATION=-